ncbi:MAG: hypothetical protein NC832_01545 [Candidatus Omnitrophica bacterium]|nr:hypothetical protein [Candidatus Omnitrophota bacterium]
MLNYGLKNFYIDITENRFGVERISFYKLSVDNVKGEFNDITQGYISFSFYGGDGSLTYTIEEICAKPPVSFKMRIKNINISRLVHALHEDIYISGVIDAEGKGSLNKPESDLEITFKSRKKKGVKQVMNFGAIKVIASLSGGSVIKSFGTSDFPYRMIAGRVTINDNYLTIEGLAGRKGYQELLIKKGLFKGINLFIDRRFNTIEIQDLRNRIIHAIETMKK